MIEKSIGTFNKYNSINIEQDRIIENTTAIGVPVCVFSLFKYLNNCKGATEITKALKELGLGFGMSGGIIVLLALSIIGGRIGNSIVSFMYKKRVEDLFGDDYSIEAIKEIIERESISEEMKLKLITYIDSYQKDTEDNNEED